MTKPRKIEFQYSTGYWGMGSTEIKEYSHETTNWQIGQDAWKGAIDNAAFYGITPYIDGDEFNDDKCPHYVGDNIRGTWREFL